MDKKMQTLLKVIETGSFVRAAEILGITQPAVSLQIRQLENDYAEQIFDRSGGKITLTDGGRQIARYAELMMKADAALRTSLTGRKEAIEEIRFGMNPAYETGPFPEVLASLSKSHPKYRFVISTDPTMELYRRLDEGELDLCLLGGHIQSPSLQFIGLDYDLLTLIVSPEHPLANRDCVSLSEIVNIPTILRPFESGTGKLLEFYLEGQSLRLQDFHIELITNNVCTIKELVRKNYAVSILTRSTCQYELRSHSLIGIPIEEISNRSEINLVLSSRAYTMDEKGAHLRALANEYRTIYHSLL